MRLYELPYFLSLANSARFQRLMFKLSESNPDACGDILETMMTHRDKAPEFADRVRDFAYESEVMLFRGDNMNVVPMLKALSVIGHFDSQQLTRLRRLISRIEDYANDRDEAMDWMRSELDVARCDDCGDWEYSDMLRDTYGSNDVCRSCINDSYIYVSRYDQYVYSDSVVTALDEDGDQTAINENDEEFVWNSDLRMRVHIDYEYEPPQPEVLGNYHSSKSQFRFQRDDWTKDHSRFLGVELEVELVDRYAERKDKARQLNELINEGDVGRKVFFENDGSLTNGFEVITHPMSLPAHRELWKWLQDKGATKGLVSHKSTTCGLHVHVNRDSLTKLQIAKMVAFVNNPDNEEFMTSLARRYGNAMTGFCRIKADKAKVGKAAESSDRYEAVNVTPRNTIEFRIFRGTLKYESLVAAIEFVHALCEYTARCGDCSVSDLGYEAFLKFAETKLPKETQTLRSYVSNRLETA